MGWDATSGLRRDQLRVLVAEDEPLAAMVVEEILLEQGHHVTLAGDGQAALDLAHAARFDILVTDLAMPRMPGWELIPRMRALRPGMPVVVMTGFLPPGLDDILVSAGTGPVVVLQKPFDLTALISAVEEVAGVPVHASLKQDQAAKAV
jgi:CheY-like chemotaxis protein